ncbi:hypothetical protein JCGZ_15242 [Jatropha curcas]|uniref:Aminotransferase-like plant mobile domain-containing protein n=1 Tax=Jatropha curcas TaxID=180498 RepID=A0A067K656_JATCU|nr:hypothetical protein JCGZ_15242 [Jatropha curcas]
MSQLSEIPASAYTPEMETLGAIPDIPTFDGETILVSRNPLTSGTRPLQLLPLPGTEFSVRYETSRMRDFQTELRDAALEMHGVAVEMRGIAVEMHGASVLRMPNFEQLRGAAVEARDTSTEVRDAAILQASFPTCHALRTDGAVERLHPHVRVCFSEMTLTPVDYAAITGLRFAGPAAPLDTRYQMLHSELSWFAPCSLLLTPWEGEAWSTYPGREVTELHTQSRLLLQGYWLDRYFLGERVFDISAAPAQWRVPHAPPRHMCMLEGMTAEDREEEYEGSAAGDFLSAGDYLAYFSTRMQARLPEVLEYTQTHKIAAHYRAEAAAKAKAAAAPAGPTGVVLGDVPFPLGMEVVLDPGLGLGLGIIIPAFLHT